MSAMAELAQGAVVAGCRVEAVVGSGGMGVVYRATQLSLERPGALKAIAPELAGDSTFRERFKRESRIAASIEHPNVIPVYEAGVGDRDARLPGARADPGPGRRWPRGRVRAGLRAVRGADGPPAVRTRQRRGEDVRTSERAGAIGPRGVTVGAGGAGRAGDEGDGQGPRRALRDGGGDGGGADGHAAGPAAADGGRAGGRT